MADIYPLPWTAAELVAKLNSLSDAVTTTGNNASTATQKATAASNSASAAATSEANAKASETAAKASETAASNSKTAAGNSETAAANSSSSAASSASSASDSATAAAVSKNDAAAYAGNARTNTTYAVDSGTANSLVVTLSPPLTAHIIGFPIYVKINANNSGDSVINLNGLGNVGIRKLGSTILSKDDLKAGKIYCFIYDGTNYQASDIASIDGPYTKTLTKTANATLSSNDAGSSIVINASSVITITLQDCLDNMSYQFINVGSMYATITSANAFKHAELPDGLTSVNIAPGDTLEVCCIGTVWQITKSSELDREYVNYFDNPALALQTSGATSITPTSGQTSANYFFDRWWCSHGITSTLGPVTWSYEARSVPDVSYALNFIKAAARTTVAITASEFAFSVYQAIPGITVATLVNKTVTIAFYAYVSVAGTYCTAVRNRDFSYSYVKKFTLAANTLTLCTMTLPLSSAYMNPNNTYTNGLSIIFGGFAIPASSFATASTDQWTSGNKLCSTDATYWVQNTTATISIGAFQLLVGGNPRRFRVPDFEEVKSKCSFYRPTKMAGAGDNTIIASGYAISNTDCFLIWDIKTRVAPTGLQINNFSGVTVLSKSVSTSTTSFGNIQPSNWTTDLAFSIVITGLTGLVAGNLVYMVLPGPQRIYLTGAEL